jgi:glucose-1-phosphate adenylyltransferase
MISMRTPEKILAIVLAGGRDEGLYPLTQNNAKATVVVGGYRLVDFVLSNLVNSGIDAIYLLSQYHSEPLVEHVHANWTFASGDSEDRFVRVVVPGGDPGSSSQGAAAAIFQNFDLIERHEPDLVAVFAADQVCRMNVRQMVDYHQGRNADATVAVTRLPSGLAASLGAVAMDNEGAIRDFQRSSDPSFCPEGAHASMGSYLFDPEVLRDSLEQSSWHGEASLSRDLLPRLVRSRRVYAYDFAANKIPGVRPDEEAGYWRNIESLEDYLDVLEDIDGYQPRFRLHNPYWPVLPPLAAQRPLLDVHYAQLLVAHRRRIPEALSFRIVG